MDQYAVLVFRDQNITDEQQVAFSQNFGEIEMKKGGNIRSEFQRTGKMFLFLGFGLAVQVVKQRFGVNLLLNIERRHRHH